MKPMLAAKIGPKWNRFPCFGQRKLNGVRALFQQYDKQFDRQPEIWQSRDEKVWKYEVLKHLSEELRSLNLQGLILDGELYKHGWRLQRINGAVAVNRLQPREDTGEIEFHVFDVVDPHRKFSDRWFEIYHLLLSASLPHIRPVETILLHDRATLNDAFHLYTREGYEGIMLRPDGPYEFGEHLSPRTHTLTRFNSKFLWKHKVWDDDEFICVGVTEGEGKADIGVGALICALTNGTTFGVGTGLTDVDRIEFSSNPPIGKQIRVRYVHLTENGTPFNPSFLAVL